MADMIRCQQKSIGTVCILTPDYANTRDTAEHGPYQQLASMIDGCFHFCVSSLSLLVRDRKVIFQAD
jgi:hypothetical protein